MLSSALNFLTDRRRRFLRAETVPVFESEQLGYRESSPIGSQGSYTETLDNLLGDFPSDTAADSSSGRTVDDVGCLNTPSKVNPVAERNMQKQRRETYLRSKKARGSRHTVTGCSSVMGDSLDCSLSQVKLEQLHSKKSAAEEYVNPELSIKCKPSFGHNSEVGDTGSFSDSQYLRASQASRTMLFSDNGESRMLQKHGRKLSFTSIKDYVLPDHNSRTNFTTPSFQPSLQDEQSVSNSERYYTTSQLGNTGNPRGRVARMRAKAAARAAIKNNKVHRSHSSVQLLETNQSPECKTVGNRGIIRSSSSNRDRMNDAKISDKLEVQSMNSLKPNSIRSVRNGRPEKQSNMCSEKPNPRSRSAASHSNTHSHLKVNNYPELTCKRLTPGTAMVPQKIHTSECGKNTSRTLEPTWLTAYEPPKVLSQTDYTWSDNRSIATKDQCSTFLKLPSESVPAKINAKLRKRRLRRNNSSLQNGQEIRNEVFPTVTTAGDLMCKPKVLSMKQNDSKTVNNNRFTEELMGLIEFGKLSQLVSMINGCELDLRKCNIAGGLSLLDCACLISSTEIIKFLIGNHFEPGMWLQTTLERGPIHNRLKDPIKFQLTRKIAEADDNLRLARAITQAAINHANEINARLVESSDTVTESENLNKAFAEVEKSELSLSECICIKKRYLKLFTGLHRFPTAPGTPLKVHTVVSGSNSIMVRISYPGHNAVINDPESSKLDYSDLSSDEDSCTQMFCEGRQIRETLPSQYSKLTLRYRIEWSTSKDFLEDNPNHCVVIPPIRQEYVQTKGSLTQSIPQKVNNCIERLLKTGFYELCDLLSDVELYVRVFALSIRGWSIACASEPASLKPSAWFTYHRADDSGDTSSERGPPLRYVGSELETELIQAKLLLDRFLLNWHTKPHNNNSVGATNNDTDHLNIEGISEESNRRKRSKSPTLQRKRSFRFLFPNKTIKFVKQTKSGVHLALLCYAPNSVSESQNDTGYSERSSGTANYGGTFQMVTTDDAFLPMLVVTKEDHSYSNNFNIDLNWFARLLSNSNNGPEIQLMSDRLSLTSAPTNLQFRLSLLTTVQRLQSSLGINDIGNLYPEVFKTKIVDYIKKQSSVDYIDKSELGTLEIIEKLTNEDPSETGMLSKHEAMLEPSEKLQNTSIIILIIKRLKHTNEVSLSGGLKWCSVQKFMRQNKAHIESNITQFGGQNTIGYNNINVDIDKELSNVRPTTVPTVLGSSSSSRVDQVTINPESHLVSRLESLLWYSQKRGLRLQPGLYVAFIQMQATLEQQPVILGCTSHDVVNMLPVERVRYRSHVAYSEWALLHALAQTDLSVTPYGSRSVEDLRFVHKLCNACTQLSERLSLSNDDAAHLRLYLPEVIQISPKHAFILVFPPVDQVCLAPLQKTVVPNNCYWQSMSHFERNLSATYDPVFHSRISNLTAILEVLVPICLFLQRQCLSEAELGQCMQRTRVLQGLQQDLNTTYQSSRWLSEAISFARDKKRPVTLTLGLTKLTTFLKNLSNETTVSLAHIQTSDHRLPAHSIQSATVDCKEAKSARTDDALRLDRNIGIIQVYATYASGLPTGTSVRLMLGHHTTAREIVVLVVNRLKEVLQTRNALKAKHDLCVDSQPKEHYLCVSLANGLQYFLPNHFRPLLLRQPWRTGTFAISLIDQHQISLVNVPFRIRGNSAKRLQRAKTEESIRPNAMCPIVTADPCVKAHICPHPEVHRCVTKE